MEQKQNIFLKKIPDWLSNIVKGLLFLVITIPVVGYVWVIAMTIEEAGQMKAGAIVGGSHMIANIIAAVILLISTALAALTMTAKTRTKSIIFFSIFWILVVFIVFV